MNRGNWTALDCAKQYLGMKEVPGHESNPAILAMLKLDMKWPTADEVPWCSAFVNWVCFNMGLEESYSLRARSWLLVGKALEVEKTLHQVCYGIAPLPSNTVVILKRGRNQPGPEVTKAPGHVGFLSGADTDAAKVYLVGGNQGDKVSRRAYPMTQILGIRKLKREARY